jgi:hypothetical protein
VPILIGGRFRRTCTIITVASSFSSVVAVSSGGDAGLPLEGTFGARTAS